MKRLIPAFLIAASIGCGQDAPKPAPIVEAPSPGMPCWDLHRHGKKAEATACFTKLTGARDALSRAEGAWGLGLFNEANDAFKAALAANDKSIVARVRWGRFFLERYNEGDAGNLFQEALELDEKNPQALLGMALTAAGAFDPKAPEMAKKALEADPKLVEAQELLAHLALEDMSPSRAVTEADKAIAMSPEALDAFAIRAAVEILADRSPQEWLDKIAKVNPAYSDGYQRIGHHLIINRRYEDGIAYYRKSLALDVANDSVRSQLGIELMRIGEEAEARKLLEEAYEHGWRDNPTVNTLRLMDSYKNFITIEAPKYIVKLHKKEADLLKLYVPAELERAIETYEKKYNYKVPGKVQLEVYPDHEDFAVRTLGMPGLGALGVTFGAVVAMDSPSGRPPAEFHWASTLWHELSHVYALGITKHRVPRWFTEGLAVHEETANNKDWGDRMSPMIVQAIKEKKLLPIAELDRGFIRPSYQAQVIVSYFQGGQICDYIAERWGYQKLQDMLRDFAGNHPTPEVIKRQLGIETDAFDSDFMAWLNKRVGAQVDAYSDWQKRMKALTEVVKGGDDAVALPEAEALSKLYPDYVEKGNPYEIAAGIYEKKGDKAKARQLLEAWAKQGGRIPTTLTKLAKMQDEAGMIKEAADTLEHLNWIYPVHQGDAHRHLGDLYSKLKNSRGVIREYEAVVAENPVDPASARFELAKAYLGVGERDKAEANLLEALEAAPGYRPAQKLLLELSSGGNGKN